MGLDQNEFERSAAVPKSCNRFLSRLGGEAVTPCAGITLWGIGWNLFGSGGQAVLRNRAIGHFQQQQKCFGQIRTGAHLFRKPVQNPQRIVLKLCFVVMKAVICQESLENLP